jgi:hypothetical protein
MKNKQIKQKQNEIRTKMKKIHTVSNVRNEDGQAPHTISSDGRHSLSVLNCNRDRSINKDTILYKVLGCYSSVYLKKIICVYINIYVCRALAHSRT